MSDFTMIVGTNSTGPVGNPPFNAGDGTGYYDGATNGDQSCGNISVGGPPVYVGGNPANAKVSCAGWQGYSGGQFVVVLYGTWPQDYFAEVQASHSSVGFLSLQSADATYSATDQAGFTIWYWSEPDFEYSYIGEAVNITFQGVSPPVTTNIPGQGDITNPESWQDAAGNIPPLVYQNVPVNTNYPQNGDGRYWFTASADTGTTASITFIGATDFLIDTASLQATITQAANDGSAIYLTWSNGITTGSVQLGPSLQDQSLLTSSVAVPLYTTGALTVGVYASGGTALSTATPWEVALAITRNVNETLPWDYSNPFNPIGYNAACMDNSVPTDTLADLRQRILIRLGFASQSANPTPGMTLLVNDFLESAQTYLYRRYKQLHTTRLFRWKINPGQRFYSLKDNDEDAMCNFNMDPNKKIEWAGIQDSRNVWYPLVQGIPPQLYTMINKPWRPARYEIRQAIEVYPAPDQAYWMWMKGHFGLMAFTLDTNSTTLDCELVFLHALANAKAHYGQPDANNIEAQANAYRMELIAGTHQTASYIPGTIAVPPAVRPTLIQYQDNQGG